MTSSAHVEHAIAPRRWSLEDEFALSSSPLVARDAVPPPLRARSPIGVLSLSPASDAVVVQRPYASSPHRHSSLPVPRDSASASHAHGAAYAHAHSVSPIGRSPLDYHVAVPPTPAPSYDLFNTEPPEWLEFFQPPHARNAASPGSPLSHSAHTPGAVNVNASYPPQSHERRERSISGSGRQSSLPRYASSPVAPAMLAGHTPSSMSSWAPSSPTQYAGAFGSSLFPSLGGERRAGEGPSSGWMDEWLQGMGGLELDARSQPTSPPRPGSAASQSLFMGSEPFTAASASSPFSGGPYGSLHSSYDDAPAPLPYTTSPATSAGRGRGRRSSAQEAFYASSPPQAPPRRSPAPPAQHYGSHGSHYPASRSYGSADYGSSVPVMMAPRAHPRGAAMSPPQPSHAMRTGRSPREHSGHAHTPTNGNGSNGATLSEGKRRTSTSTRDGEDPQRFDVVLDRVRGGLDRRTTLMIKNIPNKYDQRMLLEKLDERYGRLYDFFYLPIDFKNKCNVGYAFINFIDSVTIATFFEDFNMRKWDRFNSEKVCRLAYARIQGKLAFIEHFRNSSLMYEDESCRPLIFFTMGPSQGLHEPFPEPTVPLRPAQPEPDMGNTGDVERDVPPDASY